MFAVTVLPILLSGLIQHDNISEVSQVCDGQIKMAVFKSLSKYYSILLNFLLNTISLLHDNYTES